LAKLLNLKRHFMKPFKQYLLIILAVVLSGGFASAQTKPAAAASPTPLTPKPAPQTRPAEVPFNLADYGASFQTDPRLIVVMAALNAAGFDPTPAGREPSVFRARVTKDQAELDANLRQRMRSYYEHHKLPAPATAADQAARYVSLAYVLGPPPGLEAPERLEELPAGVLEVLDFAQLLREFYRKSGIDERLTAYLRAYQAEGDRLRTPSEDMVRAILSFLHTKPITISSERVRVRAPTANRNKKAPQAYAIREHERHFYIVPDLLAAPGTINLRVIADEYYALVPEGTDPISSELRRAYIQYVIDPLMLRFNREISARREPLKQLLKSREVEGETITPDVFLATARSLVAAADARFNELVRLQRLAFAARDKLAGVKDVAARASITRETQTAMDAIHDESIAQLAESYEHGAVLAFFFEEQLEGIGSSGFDVANFFPDMIASFDPVREARRPAEYATARARALAARQERLARRTEPDTPAADPAESAKSAVLVKELSDIEQTLRQKDYSGAEARLKELIKAYPGEPRIFFALAQTASVAAADATDENTQAQRLNNALSNYRFALAASSSETDPALISRAHEAMGRIHAFFDRKEDAKNEFEAAIKIGDVRGGAYAEALAGKKKLDQP
jgi:hypothetical protein